MTRHILAVCVAAALVAGCGAGGDGGGKAQVWITRDRGAHVIAVRTVPAGLTGMQALDRVADIETRYGGRFVQSIEGVEGNIAARRDWFYFVNGIEGDRSAAEVRLRAGDVEWWDLRSWKRRMSVPVVVGAWPKPVAGDVLVIADGRSGAAGQALARSVDATADGRHRVLVVSRRVVFHGERDASGKVTFTISAADARRLARNPKLARFRYEGLP